MSPRLRARPSAEWTSRYFKQRGQQRQRRDQPTRRQSSLPRRGAVRHGVNHSSHGTISDRQEQHVVAVRQRLQQPRDAEAPEPSPAGRRRRRHASPAASPASTATSAPGCAPADRRGTARTRTQVPRQNAASSRTGQPPPSRKAKNPDSAYDSSTRDVVGRERTRAGDCIGVAKTLSADEMLRQRERARHRRQDRRVPPRLGERHAPARSTRGSRC